MLPANADQMRTEESTVQIIENNEIGSHGAPSIANHNLCPGATCGSNPGILQVQLQCKEEANIHVDETQSFTLQQIIGLSENEVDPTRNPNNTIHFTER